MNFVCASEGGMFALFALFAVFQILSLSFGEMRTPDLGSIQVTVTVLGQTLPV